MSMYCSLTQITKIRLQKGKILFHLIYGQISLLLQQEIQLHALLSTREHKIHASWKRSPTAAAAPFPDLIASPQLLQPQPHTCNNIFGSHLRRHPVMHHLTVWALQLTCNLAWQVKWVSQSMEEAFLFVQAVLPPCPRCSPLELVLASKTAQQPLPSCF